MLYLFKQAYFKKLWYDQKFVILWLAVFSFCFEFAFCWLLFEAEFNKLFEQVAHLLPPSLMNFIGVTAGGSYYGSQLLVFGYSHPLILISLSLLPIGIPSRYIAGEIENKTMDLLFSRSIHRSVVPTHLFAFLLFCLFVESLALFAGTFIGNSLFALSLDLSGYLNVIFVTFLFFSSMGAIALFIASFQNEKGKSLARIVSLFVILYFFDTVVRLNKGLEHLTSFSFFNLYQPSKILKGDIDYEATIIILLVLIIITFAAAILRFNKRDL
jgi:ABC-type transport system involved in multi-copper enzyme maturation permease subunit